MTWATLKAIQTATRIEFTAALAAQHCFVQVASGRWSRVLGAPSPEAVWVRGRIYRMP